MTDATEHDPAESWISGKKIVRLYPSKDVPEKTVSLPMVAFPGEPPNLLLVESKDTGRRALANTTTWGNPSMPRTAEAVRVSGSMLKVLQPSNPQPKMPARLYRVRWHHVVVYKKGYLGAVVLSALGAVAAITAAVATFLGDKKPLALGIAVLALVCGSAIAVAITKAKKAAGKA
ncbi:MAG TPA: hypothetical protein VMT37_01820 [Solirubrobacterales bacterium]|nr:hypothetical protein [Solirubrobacterales bacterium]